MASSQNPLPRLKLLQLLKTASRGGMFSGALMIGLALFLLFRGFGVGSGTAATTTSPEIPTTAAPDQPTRQNQTSDTKQVAVNERSLDQFTAEERRAISGNILTVLIDERKFLIQISETPAPVFRSAAINRIPELALQCPGDANGIRVRILRRETARPSAEADLRRELEKVRITADNILMPEDTIP
jgi:hypothetical protein